MNPTEPLPIDTFLPRMRDVIRCEQSLHELNLMWRMIESSAKMNCPTEAKTILPTMAATRANFNRLEEELVTGLVREKVATVQNALGAKAQYVINILVRNLYERTADVNFLATDNELCAFVAGTKESTGNTQSDDQQRIRARLLAYRSKYTVYDEIILLDVAGNVLVQVDEATPLEGSSDPLIAQTLAADNYIETFRASSLRPGKKQALIYSRRMLHPETGAIVGVLCLCFNLEQEGAGIFLTHRDTAGCSIMLLLDNDNRVILSADELWIPLNTVVPTNHSATPTLKMLGGREYLVRTFKAEGYQGYMGPPGWQGQVMIPLEVAFNGMKSSYLAGLDKEIFEGLLSHAHSFCPPLYEIMTAAETIRRVVWNGQVMTAGQHGELMKLKTILDQISETGNRSNELFAKSINDLYDTVLASSLNDAEFVSALLIDLMDRNLYERSDDCRWWALTPELQITLANPERDWESIAKLNNILNYINRLYTVYTRIFVYDNSGRIIASSDTRHTGTPDNIQLIGTQLIGMQIDDVTLEQVQALRTEQDYYVSPFSPSALYDDAPTYVYHAAIRDPDNNRLVVGGIGLVFDSTPEFSAMLEGGLSEQADCTAYFINRQGVILSSTDASRPAGTHLALNADLLALPNGDSASRIIIHDGNYNILGCTASSGYREFKVTDGYHEDVLAVLLHSFGSVRERKETGNKSQTTLIAASAESGGHEFATFFIDGSLYALPADCVLEALPASAIAPVSMDSRIERVGLLAQQHDSKEKKYVWVFDLGYLMHGNRTVTDNASQVIIVRYNKQTLGLLVSELHGVPQFTSEQIVPSPFYGDTSRKMVTHVIKANNGQLLIQSVDVIYLFDLLMSQRPEIPAEDIATS